MSAGGRSEVARQINPRLKAPHCEGGRVCLIQRTENFQTVLHSWFRIACSWFCNRLDIFVALLVFIGVWYFALISIDSRQFVVSIVNALAWPITLLLLVGYRFREPLLGLIERITEINAAGMGVKADAKAYTGNDEKSLRDAIQTATNPKEKKRLEILVDLPIESLRLLGIVSAVGNKRDLTLGMYTNHRNRKTADAYRKAKEQLLTHSLIRPDGKFYRPTREGIEVLKLHLDRVF